ncbi:MAG: GNAT family N-acetyltransferase [Flavobacteriaceae bacterium]|nr:GNAT family N-acetyltransferase [Flavobacteriaceae bacterium]
MIKTTTKTFNELSITELYDVLRLRSQVFVVEQDCVYQDVDDKDQKALHLFISDADKIVGYTRMFDKGDSFKEASIGRVVVQENHRDKKLGHTLIKESIKAIQTHYNTSKIKISAQTHLKHFYESHGFIQTGSEYLEDGIPHIKMKKE